MEHKEEENTSEDIPVEYMEDAGAPFDPYDTPEGFRSGFVAIIGEPNVGKSTLLNGVLDFKVAIVSAKAQTTRDRLSGIYTDARCQAVFVDTPGVMEPADKFNEALRDTALEALEGADVILHLVDATKPIVLPDVARKALEQIETARLLVVNKTDRLPDSQTAFAFESSEKKRRYAEEKLHLPFDASGYDDIFYISALKGVGTDTLLEAVRERLPEGPYLYDPEQLTDRDMRFLASEIVREKVLQFLEQEVPYSVATRCEDFVERPESKHLVQITIFVEQESQKAIVIGKRGAMLRKIGSAARPEIEAMCDHPVYLELWVKVRKKWRKREESLREFGYQSQSSKKKRKKR
ncbi:MAG: GTPase Era [Candidatus Sumerlaeota bacterium]